MKKNHQLLKSNQLKRKREKERKRKKKNLMMMETQFQKRSQNLLLSKKLKVQGALPIEIK
jgi:hypothetical protein